MFCQRCRNTCSIENLRQYKNGYIACVWCVQAISREYQIRVQSECDKSLNRDQDLIFGVGAAGIGAAVGGPVGAAVGAATGLFTSWLLK
jgi:hypothetical protein